ncbi:MAG: tetratricopeptide repeat protein [Nitrospirota bacterium]
MPYKIKVPSRPIERDDVIALHWLDRWTAWEHRHRRWLVPLVIGAVIAGLALGGGGGWWWWQNRQAAVLAGQAAEHYPAATSPPADGTPTLAERCAKAIPFYQQITEQYGRSRFAPLALYYQANCEAELGHADQAVRLYRQAIADYPSAHEVAPFSAARLGYLYASQDNRSGAIEQFRWITERAEAPNRDQAHYELGRLHEADNNRDAALAAYTSLYKDFQKSPWATEAATRIKQLGGELPAPPDQPKAPPAEGPAPEAPANAAP